MSINKSNSFTNESNGYSLPKTINFAHFNNGLKERDTYIIEYKNGCIYDRGWFKKGRVKPDIIETYDLSDTIKTLDFNNKQLLECILMLYQEIAGDIQLDISRRIRDKDTEIVDKLGLEYCLYFLRDYHYENEEIKSIESYLRNAFTAYKLNLEFYEKYYDNSFISKQYIEPFKDLIDRVGFNTSMLEGYGKYNLFTKIPNELNRVLLCYDLLQDKFVVRTFNASNGDVWKHLIPGEYSENEYYIIGFLPVKYLWDEFEKGDYSFMYPIEMIMGSISYQAGEIGTDTYDVMILNNLDLELEEDDYDEEITPNDKEKLLNLSRCYTKIKADKYNKNEIHVENYKEFMEILRDILINNKFINEQLKSDKPIENKNLYELLELIKPLV